MKVISEVLGEDVLELTADFCDVLQIGSRNSQNFQLLKKVALYNKPVMLKRGFMNTIEEFLLASEYIAQGNDNIILCERGIRTFETSTRNTLDISAVAVIHNESHLPVIVDPSHAAGRRDLILPLTRAAVACGAQGAIIEVHPHPDKALCDGKQSLSFKEFAHLWENVKSLCEALEIKIV